jgi:hypothetical protein
MTSSFTLAAMAGLAPIVAATGIAEAQSRRGSHDGYVKACSRYGHGCTGAPIRRGAFDFELRMPGGTWVSCRADCKEALREEVLDFWETQRERAGDRVR